MLYALQQSLRMWLSDRCFTNFNIGLRCVTPTSSITKTHECFLRHVLPNCPRLYYSQIKIILQIYYVLLEYLKSFFIFIVINSICYSMLYLSFVAEFTFINDNKSMSSTNPHLFSSMKSFNRSDTAVAKSIVHSCNWWTTSSSPFLNQVEMLFLRPWAKLNIQNVLNLIWDSSTFQGCFTQKMKNLAVTKLISSPIYYHSREKCTMERNPVCIAEQRNWFRFGTTWGE